VQQLLRAKSKGPTPQKNRLTTVEREVANLTDAIASGMLRASPAIADRLAQAEAELARLKAAPPPVKAANLERLIPEVADHYRNLVGSLETSLAETDVERARGELRTLFGYIRVVADEWEVRLEADLRETQAALLRAA
jgi:hypothetical protein